MLYCMKIQQLILNTDPCKTYMTFHVQLLKWFTIMEGTMLHVVRQNNFAYGTLGMPLNMDKSRAVTWHWMYNIKAHLNYNRGPPCVMGGQYRPKSRLA